MFKDILREYRSCSGQCVNFEKSTVFFSRNTTEEDRILVANLMEIRSLNEPERYLGLLNMVGRRKNESFQNLKDRLEKRIDNWFSRFLSQGVKEIFIKSILQAIPTYMITCFLLPKKLCNELESIVAKFWRQKGHGRRAFIGAFGKIFVF